MTKTVPERDVHVDVDVDVVVRDSEKESKDGEWSDV
jgi:hypothetical protein